MSETNETNEINFENYADAIETVALKKMEIKDIFKQAANIQKRLWKAIFGEKDTSKYDFAKKMLFYQAGVPNADSKAKLDGFRKQFLGMLQIFYGMGLEDNIKSYFSEVGIDINLRHDPYSNFQNFEPSEKASKMWDMVYFGEEMPYNGTDILKQLMQTSQNIESDIVESNKEIEKMSQVACMEYDISPAGFKKAVDIMIADKDGKDIQEYFEEIKRKRESEDKALTPFFEIAED